MVNIHKPAMQIVAEPKRLTALCPALEQLRGPRVTVAAQSPTIDET
jgi:hypothetical protein